MIDASALSLLWQHMLIVLVNAVFVTAVAALLYSRLKHLHERLAKLEDRKP